MNDESTASAINLADWIIPLNDVTLVPSALENSATAVDGPTPDLLQFPTDLEAYPTEGHHPRLMRFGRVA